MLEIEVYEIRGKRPVHKVGDKTIIDEPRIVLEETDPICVHALATLLHYVVALDEGADPVKLGPTKMIESMHTCSAWTPGSPIRTAEQ